MSRCAIRNDIKLTGQPRPDDGAQERSPLQQPKTPHRQRSSKSRLPPPSQNWRESQRPQMAFSQTESIGSQVPGSQTSHRGSPDHPGSSRKKRSRQELEEEDLEDAGTENENEEGGGFRQTFNRYSPDQLSQDTSPNPQSQDSSSQYRPESQARQETQTNSISRSSQQQPTPPIPTSTSKRHRLTDLDLPIDTDDPSDTSYRPRNSYPGDQDQDEDEEYEDQPENDSPEPEPEGKRIKLTEGAWMKYDIPQDKIPAPRHPIQAKKTRPVDARLIKPIKNESQSQSQSQISQIEQSDDEEDTSVSWLGEDIDESLSQNYSDISAKGNKNGKLSTIAEEEDEEDEEDEGMEQVHNGGGSGQKGWVEDGFFGDGGGTGFTVWRDRY